MRADYRFVVHATYVTSNAYSHPSVVLQSSTSSGGRIIMDDFREAYYWLRQNTRDDARVMSWYASWVFDAVRSYGAHNRRIYIHCERANHSL